MTLYTKCILSRRENDDGIRISVMSRHTLNDGITPDLRISDSYDTHFSLLAPRPRLIGDYYKRSLKWEDFERRFLIQIQELKSERVLRRIAEAAVATNVTFLCIEDSAERCHRRLLAEACQRFVPELIVIHR